MDRDEILIFIRTFEELHKLHPVVASAFCSHKSLFGVTSPEEFGALVERLERIDPQMAWHLEDYVRKDLETARRELEVLKKPKPQPTLPEAPKAQPRLARSITKTETRPRKPTKTTRKPRAKHSQATKARALKLLASGMSARAVGKELGVHHATVARWKNATGQHAEVKHAEVHAENCNSHTCDTKSKEGATPQSKTKKLLRWLGVKG